MALPSIANLFEFEIPQTNVVIQEEETHNSSVVVYEKTLPKTLNVHDFIKFLEMENGNEVVPTSHDFFHKSPHLSIFSPPPEA